MLKKDLNINIHLGEGNIKLVGAENIQFLTWSIPAKITCKYATPVCLKICYAYNDELRRPNVKKSRLRNFEESLKSSFVKDMVDILNYNLTRKKYKDKIIIVRIHESGDFTDMNYLNKFIQIANNFKGNNRILFQAYTKALPLLEQIDLNEVNIKFVYSVMSDTTKEQIEAAKKLGLTTFEAKHVSKITVKDTVCQGECGPCLLCYKGQQTNITIAQHGMFKNKAV